MSGELTGTTPWDDLASIATDGKYPGEPDRSRLLDEYRFQRAVQTYLGALPAVNMLAMQRGSEATWGAGYNVLPIWKKRMDAHCKVPTPNADVIYAMSYLDLEQDGPLVITAPPGILGMLTDFWQRPMTDVGFAGPDKGAGGQYLIVPPLYDGPPLPGGYHVFHSPTYRVFLFWRAFLKPGAEGPDPTDGVATLEQTLIYPLRQTNPSQWKPMQFPDASGVDVDMLFPRDDSYFDLLDEFIQAEPVESVDLYLRGIMASMGIVKGKPFAPDDRMRTILDRAARIAPMMGHAVNVTPDAYPDRQYYTDAPKRRWINGFPGIDEYFLTNSYLNLDHRMT
ncbi:DUF1254 domain-containing protein, partial [Isoptericola sp. NPDC056134]|uniref:DUF1254 domain-containing protein n=1 Tax=Isoptericola sp. NPDC056134 TaxID=3345723 RepID=UPI0035EA6B01